MSDISKFEECTNRCKNYLRENVMRRLNDIESIHTLVCIIIIFTSIILILLLVLLLLKVRGRKRTKSNCNVEDTAMHMKKLQEIALDKVRAREIFSRSGQIELKLKLGERSIFKFLVSKKKKSGGYFF